MKRSKLGSIAACLLVAITAALPGARAQDATPPKPAATDTARKYAEEFQRGYDALKAERWAEGIASMKRCLELAPEDPTSAYNLACASARQGQVDAGVEWFA